MKKFRFKKESLGLNYLVYQILESEESSGSSILSMILRENMKMNEEEQNFFVEFCVSLFSIYDFKKKLITNYCQFIENIVPPRKRKKKKF